MRLTAGLSRSLAPAIVGLAALSSVALSPIAGAAEAEGPVAVEVANHSVVTKCAEEDNIYYTLKAPADGPKVTGFSIETKQVPYLQKIVRDSTLPDFTDCSFGQDWAPDAHPYTAVLYEDNQFILKGVVYPDFWRPTTVPVKVGKLTQNFLHLVQLWKKTASGPIEFLVFYPQDGYWRLKTLPPFRMPEVAYGSSFLIGPIETSTRPFVAYKSVEFDPATVSFTLEFAKGGKAKVTVAELLSQSIRLDVTLDGVDATSAEGFAGLRSMFVTPERSDAAETRWVAAKADQESVASIVEFKSSRATRVTFGRSVPSRHNTSAPNMSFFDFKSGK